MQTLVTGDGVTLAYVDAGSGPPLVFVPGGCSSMWWFREQLALADRFRVVGFDPRGQGESEKTARGQRVARFAADLADLLHTLDLHGVHLVAWSGGASTTLQYIENHGSDRLASLTFVGASPRLMRDDDWDLAVMDLEGALSWVGLVRTDMTAAASLAIPRFFTAGLSPAEFDATVHDMCKCHGEGMARACWEYFTRDYRDMLPRISLPMLVIAGEHDVTVPPENAAYLADAVPHARAEVLADASHCVFLEQPETFNALVADFALSVAYAAQNGRSGPSM